MVDNESLDEQQEAAAKKRQPGKRCVVLFFNKTNADGVSVHQFPADEIVRLQWIIVQKRTE